MAAADLAGRVGRDAKSLGEALRRLGIVSPYLARQRVGEGKDPIQSRSRRDPERSQVPMPLTGSRDVASTTGQGRRTALFGLLREGLVDRGHQLAGRRLLYRGKIGEVMLRASR